MPTLRGLRNALQRLGYRISELSNATTALDALQNIANSDSSILLDLCLPAGAGVQIPLECEGHEVGLWLLGRMIESGIDSRRIVVLSGNVSVDVLDELQSNYSIPNHAIISKPVIEIKVLLRALNGWSASCV